MSLEFDEVRELTTACATQVGKEIPIWTDLQNHYTGNASVVRHKSQEKRDESSRRELDGQDNLIFQATTARFGALFPGNPVAWARATTPESEVLARAATAALAQDAKACRLQENLELLYMNAILLCRAFMKTTWDVQEKRPKAYFVHPARIGWDTAYQFDMAPFVVETMAYPQDRIEEMVKRGSWREEGWDATCATYLGEDPMGVNSSTNQPSSSVSQKTARIFRQHAIVEFYDLRNRELWVYQRDAVKKKPLYHGPLPYKSVPNPYVPLMFRPNLRDGSGMSDLELTLPSQRALIVLDRIAMDTAVKTNPVTLIDGSAIPDEAQRKAIVDANPGDRVAVNLGHNKSIAEAVGKLPQPEVPAHVFNLRSLIMANAYNNLNLTDWFRGRTANVGTATEVNAAGEGSRTEIALFRQKGDAAISDIYARWLALRLEFMGGNDTVNIDPNVEMFKALGLDLPNYASIENFQAVAGLDVRTENPEQASRSRFAANCLALYQLALANPTLPLDHLAILKAAYEADPNNVTPFEQFVTSGPLPNADANIIAQQNIAAQQAPQEPAP